MLEAYSAYRPSVGYLQSMNFLVAFLLCVSGGNEKQAFWFLVAILDHSEKPIPFDGIQGFYQRDFPLYQLYVKVFMQLFKEYIPDLYRNF